MRLRTLVMALVLAGALAGCTHDNSLSHALGVPDPSPSTSVDVPTTAQSSATTIPGAGSSRSSSAHSSGATTKGRSFSAPASTQNEGPRVLAPDGTDPSGVICHYVSQSDVDGVLPGAPPGEEIDLASVAVSYCNFSTSALGTVTVGVKNEGTSTGATSAVRQQYDSMSNEPDQSLHTTTVNGQLTFQVSSVTHLPSGKDLYAVNAQGSRGNWYVAIQYYAHTPCSTSAMQHLLETVLSQVP